MDNLAQAAARRAPHAGRPRLGRSLLALYLAVALILIVLIWADNLADDKTATPGYVRDTYIVDESVYLTVTAEAAAVELSLATPPLATPTPPVTTP